MLSLWLPAAFLFINKANLMAFIVRMVIDILYHVIILVDLVGNKRCRKKVAIRVIAGREEND